MPPHPAALSPRKQSARRAFTLPEMLVAVAVFVLVGGVFFDILRSSLRRTVKSVSLNDSNAALQTSFDKILTTLEGGAILVDCANYDTAAQTFTGVADGTWCNAVRFMNLLPVTGYVLPDDGSPYNLGNPPPSTQPPKYLHADAQPNPKTIQIAYNSALYAMGTAALPASARFYPAFPAAYENVTTGPSQGNAKPGLGIATATFADHVPAGTATLTLTNPMTALTPGGLVSYCNRGYFMVEGALAVVTDSASGFKRLLYFSDTNQPARFTVVAIALDGANQAPPDAPATSVSGNFCHPPAAPYVQTLLPVRSRDYSNALNLGGGSAATSGTNGWIQINARFRSRQTL